MGYTRRPIAPYLANIAMFEPVTANPAFVSRGKASIFSFRLHIAGRFLWRYRPDWRRSTRSSNPHPEWYDWRRRYLPILLPMTFCFTIRVRRQTPLFLKAELPGINMFSGVSDFTRNGRLVKYNSAGLLASNPMASWSSEPAGRQEEPAPFLRLSKSLYNHTRSSFATHGLPYPSGLLRRIGADSHLPS